MPALLSMYLGKPDCRNEALRSNYINACLQRNFFAAYARKEIRQSSKCIMGKYLSSGHYSSIIKNIVKMSLIICVVKTVPSFVILYKLMLYEFIA